MNVEKAPRPVQAVTLLLVSMLAGLLAGCDPGPAPTHYPTLAPTAQLTSGVDCALEIERTPETVPENAVANRTVVDAGLVRVDGDKRPLARRKDERIDGHYSGSTDDIIRWGACKWGIDENIVRGIAMAESTWRQSQLGDPSTYQPNCSVVGQSTPCHLSYGLVQVKGTVHTGTYPHSAESTAFAVDYGLAWIRSCYEGGQTWLGSNYAAGDLWGCVGAWYSGSWHDPGSSDYQTRVLSEISQRRWDEPGFD